ncbi:O-acetyltransferase OatA [Alloscardovia macacae]|uniref:O-acetyltransferase OatA n=2 Tax=Alloscardovia macacae TaxID=1160091 RepID=A0A261F692_9BIFI|nr:O-acetyltransferase OatA [Alloscardovia macacae]
MTLGGQTTTIAYVKIRESMNTEKRTEEGKTSRRRIRGLDGLRALSVLLVLAYHFLPQYVPQGYVGVDAFFVLSGFLITFLLIREIEQTNRLNIAGFWARRLRRLIPAVLVLLGVCVPAAFVVGGDVLLGIRRQVLSALTFTYNWSQILAGSTYFDQANPALFKNLWSFAVEEQFYLLWPLILWILLLPKMKRFSAPVTLGFAGVSLVWAFILPLLGADPTRVHLGTDSHSYGLMLGAFLACALPLCVKLRERSRTLSGGLGWLGAAGLIVLSCVPLPLGVSMTLISTLASVLSALLILAVVSYHEWLSSDEREGALIVMNGGVLERSLVSVLSIRPLGWVGVRSYGIYLWHWPLTVLALYIAPRLGVWERAGIIFVLTILFSALSWRFVEQPILQNTARGWASTLSKHVRMVVAALAAVCLIGTGLALANEPTKTSAEMSIEKAVAAQKAQKTQKSHTQPKKEDKEEAKKNEPKALPRPEITGANITVIGDSVTEASQYALANDFPGIYVDGVVNRTGKEAAGLLAAADANPNVGRRPYVVIGLAANATWRQDWLDALLTQVGADRQLILVNGFGPTTSGWIWQSNDVINAYAAAHPKQVFVADWAGQIKDHTDLLAQDFVHPTFDGGAHYFSVAVRAALEKAAAVPAVQQTEGKK